MQREGNNDDDGDDVTGPWYGMDGQKNCREKVKSTRAGVTKPCELGAWEGTRRRYTPVVISLPIGLSSGDLLRLTPRGLGLLPRPARFDSDSKSVVVFVGGEKGARC